MADGVDSCGLFIADWWLENHGIDPAENIRGKKNASVLSDGGGFVKTITAMANDVGAVETTKAVTGCFGIIGPGVCAIYAQGYWVARSEIGIVFNRDARVIRMWSI